jgi:hypothetical protein
MEEPVPSGPSAGVVLSVSGLHAAISQLVGDAALQQQLQCMLCMPCNCAEELLLRMQDTLLQHAMLQLQSAGQVESGLLQLSNLLAGVIREVAWQQQQVQQQAWMMQQSPMQPLQQQQMEQLVQQELRCGYPSQGDGAATAAISFPLSAANRVRSSAGHPSSSSGSGSRAVIDTAWLTDQQQQAQPAVQQLWLLLLHHIVLERCSRRYLLALLLSSSNSHCLLAPPTMPPYLCQ